MASFNVKFRLCLFGFTLFLACAGLGAESESLGGGLSPREEYKACRFLCELTEHGAEKSRCAHVCEKQLREQEEHGGRRVDDDGDQRRDPESEREERRREEEKHRREQERRRREQEQERRERERRGERDDEEEENRRDPDWRREQERKEQERRRREQEQERRERERRGERDDEEEENRRDPDWRKEQERKEQERRRREQEQERRERERRGEREDEEENRRDGPDWRREQERKEQERRRKEQEQERREREQRHGGRSHTNQVEIRQTEREHSHNPYYFQEHQFQSRFRSDEGHWRVLERFSERSEHLKGIKNQRLAILEARPKTFIIPHHLDAESVLLVVRGKATITTVVQEKRETKKESYNVERGDVLTVPAGTTIYLANNENEDLQIVKLIQPLNNPTDFKDFLSGGGEAQSYYSVFSDDVLEAALNIPSDKLERIFKQRGEKSGKIIRASQEQLKALSQGATSVRKGPRGTRSGAIKLQSQTPIYNNQYGQMFEVCPDEFSELRRTDVAAAVVDIKQGGMMVPHFNSRTTWVVLISEGSGSFEMACPHLQGRRQEEERSGQIERVAGRLSQGGVLVIPAGHPIAIMASPNESLRLVGFGLNAENNNRNFLAGKENIMKEVDREAKELAFNVEGKQADEIFKSQKESFFTKGPKGSDRRPTERSAFLSYLKLSGYF